VMKFAKESEVVRWDDDRDAVVAAIEKRIGTLVVGSKPTNKIPDEKRVEVLIRTVREKGLKIVGDADVRKIMQSRILSLRSWRQDDGWPDVSDYFLLNSIEEWLTPFLTGITRQTDLEKLDIKNILTSLIPWDMQSKLDLLTPEKIQVPSGSMIALQYSQEGDLPIIEVRLQEMFGLTETPTVNDGRTKILLHLLSPGYKPVQVTQDLKSFWQTTYHEVRKELRMRYPRHHWPEDPWTAEAVRGARRRNPQ
jgi:ATP-dependent helicase HrpB